MRTLIGTVFNYSLDGLLADRDTDFWEFCFSLPENNEPDDPVQLDFLRGGIPGDATRCRPAPPQRCFVDL